MWLEHCSWRRDIRLKNSPHFLSPLMPSQMKKMECLWNDWHFDYGLIITSRSELCLFFICQLRDKTSIYINNRFYWIYLKIVIILTQKVRHIKMCGMLLKSLLRNGYKTSYMRCFIYKTNFKRKCLRTCFFLLLTCVWHSSLVVP